MGTSLTQFLDSANLPAVDDGALANALTEAADDATTGSGNVAPQIGRAHV